MAPEAEEQDPEDGLEEDAHKPKGNGIVKSESEEEDEEDEGEEPRLGYVSLTKSLGAVYRNGDATSAFLVAGDKMVRCAATCAGRCVAAPSRRADAECI